MENNFLAAIDYAEDCNFLSGDVTYLNMPPAQFHFHTPSEHTIDGKQFALEMHIVHSSKDEAVCESMVGGTCLSVVGVLFDTDPNLEPANALMNLLSSVEDLEDGTATVKLHTLLPEGGRSYYAYRGSLTTPPCTEGVLWHVMEQPMYIDPALLARFPTTVTHDGADEANEHNNRELNPVNDRVVFV